MIGSEATREELLRIFAGAILAKMEAFSLPLTRREKARMKESIGSDIRKACDLLASVGVSEEAHKEAVRLGVDLQTKGWHDQPAFDHKRQTFHFEHMKPVGAICQALFAETSVESVAEVLRHNLKVAWILKSEDRELTRLGYRTKRADPDVAYRSAGIRLRLCAISGESPPSDGQRESAS